MWFLRVLLGWSEPAKRRLKLGYLNTSLLTLVLRLLCHLCIYVSAFNEISTSQILRSLFYIREDFFRNYVPFVIGCQLQIYIYATVTLCSFLLQRICTHDGCVCIKDGVLVIEKIIIEKILVMMMTTVKTMMETMMISLTS